MIIYNLYYDASLLCIPFAIKSKPFIIIINIDYYFFFSVTFTFIYTNCFDND